MQGSAITYVIPDLLVFARERCSLNPRCATAGNLPVHPLFPRREAQAMASIVRGTHYFLNRDASSYNEDGRNFNANSDYFRRTCFGHRDCNVCRASSYRTARPAADRRRRVSENSRSISWQASNHYVLGDVVRTLPRRISDVEPIDLGISAERVEGRRHQSRRRWRLDPDAALHRALQAGVSELP